MNFKKKNIAILGSTGSIGQSTIDILSNNLKFFNIKFLSCNNNYNRILTQIKKFLPKYVLINDILTFNKIKKIKFKKKIIFINNLKDFKKKLGKTKFDKVIVGIPSIEGLKYCFSFIRFSKELLIANKESIICGGKILLNKAKLFGCNIISIDSEHYCLSEILKNQKFEHIDSVYLTASGGPFFKKKKFIKKNISIEQVIDHPTWKMGNKISVDSATMINKIFEVIEAHVLFSIPFEKIKIKIHKESLVHAAVIFKNGLVKFVMHDTSMKIPIRNSLFKNNFYRQSNNYFKSKKDFILSFNESNLIDYKILKTGFKICTSGHTAWIIFNVLNDLLVSKFLNREIFFYEIEENLIRLMNKDKVKKFFKKKIYNFSDIEKVMNFAKSLLTI